MPKMKMLIGGFGAALLSTTAFGGFVQPAPVTIDTTNMFATGDQVTARYSKNKVEYIGCGIRKFDDGAGGAISFGFCQAQDVAEVQITCFTQNAALLDAISSSGEYGFVTFSWTEPVPDQLDCSRIGFSQQSFYLPKGLKANKVNGGGGGGDDDDDDDDDD